MEMIKKVFVSEIRSVEMDKHIVETVMSDETVDRYKEIIFADAYKSRLKGFMKHPILLTSHSYRGLTSQIGEWEKVWVDGDKLVGRAKYYVGEGNQEADWGFFLASKGIAAYSVGFISHSAETDPEKIQEALKERGRKEKNTPFRVYTDVELLECSQVLVPANPSALQNSLEDQDESLVMRDLSRVILTKMEKDEIFKEQVAVFDKVEEKEVEEEIEEKDEEMEDEAVQKPQSPTAAYWHVPAPGQEGKHAGHAITTISLSKSQGIKGHYCTDDKTITGYMFDKKKWSLSEAKKWVKDHHKMVFVVDTQKTGETEEDDMDQKVLELLTQIHTTVTELKGKVESMEEIVTGIQNFSKVLEESTETIKTEMDEELYSDLLEDKTGEQKILDAIKSLTAELPKDKE